MDRPGIRLSTSAESDRGIPYQSAGCGHDRSPIKMVMRDEINPES